MHPVIRKTFGGLTRQYYLRQFLFGLIFPGMMLFVMLNGHADPAGPHAVGDGIGAGRILFMAVNTLLYPYARFVYESVIGYIVGNNLFILNALVLLAVKFIMMAVCWAFAIFIAPVGLAYLYFHHSRPPADEV